MRAALCLLAFVCLVLARPAAAIEVPELRAHVLDRASLLSGSAARALEQTLVEFERTTGHQVVVHITPSLEALEIEDYSIQIASAWKVGQRSLDNGVILTVAPNERKVRIEVGYGLEGVLPDVLAARIIREQILPEFRTGRMDRGVEAGTRAILALISGEVLPLPTPDPRADSSRYIMILWIAVALALILARGLFFAPPFGGPGALRSRRSGGIPNFGGGGFGGGGGGFSGGGGGFGGGGASGELVMHVRELLDQPGRAAIEAAVRSAERATSGEIVPVIVERSDAYAELRFGAAALLAFASGGLALALAPALWVWLVPTQIGVFSACAWLLGQPALLRRLIPSDVAEKRVARAAALAFHQAGLVETRDRTGILIHVSLLEHRVTVLADRGIDARVAPGSWDDVVARVLAGIRERRAEAGLADGIRRCGEILSQHFPRRPDDLNELSNAPRAG